MLAGAALLLLASSAHATPETPAPHRKAPPEPDITPTKIMGATARTKNGPEPLAAPPSDAGMSPDPDEMPAPEKAAPNAK